MKTNYREPNGCHNCSHFHRLQGWCEEDDRHMTNESFRDGKHDCKPYGICDDYEKLTKEDGE